VPLITEHREDKPHRSWHREGREKAAWRKFVSFLCAEKIAAAVIVWARITQQTGKPETVSFSQLPHSERRHPVESVARPLTGAQRKLNAKV